LIPALTAMHGAESESPCRIEQKQIRQVLSALVKLVRSRYAIADMAEKTARFLEKNLAAGRYADFSDPAEFAAALWSMQTYAPLMLPRPWPFVLVPYEDLAADPRRELSRLFDAWQLAMPEGVLEGALRPSGTTDTGSALRAGADPSSAWRNSLSARQIDGILAVIRTFGLDFYDAAGRPDRRRLDALAPAGPATPTPQRAACTSPCGTRTRTCSRTRRSSSRATT